MAERTVLFVSNFPSWVHGFGRVCDSGEVLAILCCLNALRFVDLRSFEMTYQREYEYFSNKRKF